MAIPSGYINTQVRFNRTFRDGGFSSAAQDVFDLMNTTPPTPLKVIMATGIDALIATGDWADMEQLVVPLDTSPNSLVDWIGVQNALAVASPTFVPFNSWILNGTTQYINMQLAPSAYTKASQNDIDAGVWVVEHTTPSGTEFIFGSKDGTSDLGRFSDGVRLTGFVNSTGTVLDNSEGSFSANSLYSAIRIISNDMELWTNGVKKANNAVNSTGLNPTDMIIGARNNSGTPQLFLGGKLGLWYAKKSRGNLAFYNIINTMVTGIQALA